MGVYVNDLNLHDSSRELILAGTQQSAELQLALDQVNPQSPDKGHHSNKAALCSNGELKKITLGEEGVWGWGGGGCGGFEGVSCWLKKCTAKRLL